MIKKLKPFLLLFSLLCLGACSVKENADGSESTVYYYPSGAVSKEKTVMLDSSGAELEYWNFFYENGHLKKEGITKNKQAQGLWTFYYDGGQKQSTTYFKNDVRHGHAVYYWRSGTKKTEGDYSQGQQNGLWAEFNEKGDTTNSTLYENGGPKIYRVFNK